MSEQTHDYKTPLPELSKYAQDAASHGAWEVMLEERERQLTKLTKVAEDMAAAIDVCRADIHNSCTVLGFSEDLIGKLDIMILTKSALAAYNALKEQA